MASTSAPFGHAKLDDPVRGPDGYEAAIDTNLKSPAGTGSLINGGSKGLIIYGGPKLLAGQWFTMEVIAEANHIAIKINGATTADYTDTEHLHSVGHLALQHASPGRTIEFRKIEIKELNGESQKR